jgi:PAS domain S-box-containing protein
MLSHWFLTDDIPLALCASYHHQPGLVVASYLVAAFAAYTAFHLIARVRAASTTSGRLAWLATAGLSMGFGIWAMHFIAMLAVEIPIAIRFNLPLTVLSAGFAIVASAVAFHLVANETVSRVRLGVAGITLGSGIGLMHYVGMAALSMSARIYYDPWLFALSVVVAVMLSTAALVTLTMLPVLRTGRWQAARLAGAAVMGLAIVLMHYTGMFATYFYPEPGLQQAGTLFDPPVMAAAISFVALLLVGLALVSALFDQRAERAENLLRDAINCISEGFVIYDSADRLVICNDAYRRMYHESADVMVPGARLEDILRDGLAKGRYPDVQGLDESWLAERMRQHRSAQGTIEQQLSNGSWVLNTDRRMSNGGLVGLRIDISALKAAQTALRDSEQRFRDFAELTSDWFWEQDTNLRFTLVGNGTPLLRPGDQSHIGKLRWELNDTSRDPDRWEAHKQDVMNHRPFRDFRYDRVGPDGRTRHVSISGVPMHDESGRFLGYRGTGRDITLEVEAEAEVRLAKERAEQAETMLRDAVDSISEGFVIYDSEDRFVMCNETYRSLYAQAADLLVPGARYEAIVRQWLTRGGQADAGMNIEQALATRLEQHRSDTRTIEQQLSDGRWLMITDRPMSNGGIAGLRIDISELKSVQAALHESERRLDKAQEIAGIGSWEIDASTGDAIWSKQLYRIRGIAPDQQQTLEGLANTIHPDDWGRVREWLYQLRAGVSQQPIEYHIQRPDSEIRIVNVEGQVVTDASGAVTKITGTVQDVTERRQTERQLVQAQKMESVGQLTGGLAHDFNNILGAVIGHLDLAESDAEPGSTTAEHCQVALDAALRGAELVKRLLAFSRRQVLYPKPTNLHGVIANLLPLVERALGEHIGITTQFAPQLWPAVADTAQLESAMLNLIVNARDAMPLGGTLAIEAANVTISTTLATTSGELQPGDYAVISVSDTGSGMPPEVLAHVFEPFFTTKGPAAGSGLGLSMVFGTMQQLGGTVHIYSEVGVGTTVRLYLPRADAPQPTQAKPECSGEPLPTGDESVLMVEDNAQIRTVGTTILRGLGYQVTVADSGDAAMQHIENGERFDLLFSDIVMPGQLDGIALAHALRAYDPTVRILFTSGFSSPVTLRERIVELEGAELIAKPYRKADLAKLVRSVLNQATEAVA